MQRDDVSEIPAVEAAVHPATAGVRPNRALADRLEILHRVAYHEVIDPDAPRPGPASPEEKLLRAIFGEKSEPQEVLVEPGTHVMRGDRLLDHWQGNIVFDAADEADVESAERTGAGYAIVTVWRGPLAVGDTLYADDGELGLIDAIVEDGAAEPRLYVAGRTNTMWVTRRLPTAVQQIAARSIGPYGDDHVPLEGEVIRDEQVEWLAANGGRALVSDFAAYKLAEPVVRMQVYEAIIEGEPLADGWTATRPPPQQPDGPGMFDMLIGRGPDAPSRLDALSRGCGLAIAIAGRQLSITLREPGDPAWSRGEVTRPELLDAAGVPVPDGLACERIFGPVKDYACRCGKHTRMRDRGIVCTECGVEVIGSSVRRERFGHIRLASPIATSTGSMWSTVPVLPPLLRTRALDDRYRALFDRPERATLAGVIAAAFEILLDTLLPAERRCDFSAAAIAMIDRDVGPGHARIPLEILGELAEPFGYGIIESLGLATTVKGAKRLYREDPALRREAVRMTFNDRVVLLAGQRPELVAALVDIGDDPVMRIDPALADRLAIATGDRVVLHLPLSDAAQHEARGLGRVHAPVAATGWLHELAHSSDRFALAYELARANAVDPCEWPIAAMLAGGYPVDPVPPIALGPPPPRDASADLDRSLDELELGVGLANILAAAKLRTVRGLVTRTEADLLRLKGLGRKHLKEVKEALAALGLQLGTKL